MCFGGSFRGFGTPFQVFAPLEKKQKMPPPLDGCEMLSSYLKDSFLHYLKGQNVQ